MLILGIHQEIAYCMRHKSITECKVDILGKNDRPYFYFNIYERMIERM